MRADSQRDRSVYTQTMETGTKKDLKFRVRYLEETVSGILGDSEFYRTLAQDRLKKLELVIAGLDLRVQELEKKNEAVDSQDTI